MIVNFLMKIIYYIPIKVIINISSLVKVIIIIVICQYTISKSIIIDQGLFFILKF